MNANTAVLFAGRLERRRPLEVTTAREIPSSVCCAVGRELPLCLAHRHGVGVEAGHDAASIVLEWAVMSTDDSRPVATVGVDVLRG
ncbi:hypothetical protein C446_07412 [Halobiforma nitratireducens JCM 10879]|uniref:Uncharacterized protein n=1 Tax=Halobiforma nitratireducens JCM 10879 TaxID=1227454 RepID=M0M6I8_9EURY|nr:hypothetical protein C446_07412 [Halobiforma nitratireducens JCM 10879]